MNESQIFANLILLIIILTIAAWLGVSAGVAAIQGYRGKAYRICEAWDFVWCTEAKDFHITGSCIVSDTREAFCGNVKVINNWVYDLLQAQRKYEREKAAKKRTKALQAKSAKSRLTLKEAAELRKQRGASLEEAHILQDFEILLQNFYRPILESTFLELAFSEYEKEEHLHHLRESSLDLKMIDVEARILQSQGTQNFKQRLETEIEQRKRLSKQKLN